MSKRSVLLLLITLFICLADAFQFPGVSGSIGAKRLCRISMQAEPRRDFLSWAIPAVLGAGIAPAIAQARTSSCGDIESCREKGQAKFEAAELERGPIVRLGNGVSYRESRKGTGDAVVKPGDVVDIYFQVLRGNGYYMYSCGYSKEPGLNDLGETYRLTLGKHDVPIAVELALEGSRKGTIRRVEMPPAMGFATSNWQPNPKTFEGKQRIEGYKKVLSGNGLQPGYNAVLLFEFEVQKIRSSN